MIDEYYPQVVYTLRLRRQPVYYVVTLIIPCCLLSFISVSTFLLQPNCYDRLGLGKEHRCLLCSQIIYVYSSHGQ